MTTSLEINQRLNGAGPLDITRATRFNIYGADDALLIASLAATATSAGMGMAAQEQAAGAQRHAANAELQRQQEFQKNAQQVANESLAGSTREIADQQIQQGADNRMAAYQRVGGIASPSAASPNQFAVQPNSSAARAAESSGTSKQLAAAWNKIVAPSQARAGGYGDWGLAQDKKNTRANERIGQAGDAARGSSRVSGYEQQQASHAGDTMAGIGSVLGALGSVGGMYAATRPAAASYGTTKAARFNKITNGWPVKPSAVNWTPGMNARYGGMS